MKYISASQLTLYADCSLKHRFRYIDKIKKPSESIHLAYGSAIHKALENLNLSLLTSKNHLEDVYQDFHDEWNRELLEQNVKGNWYEKTLYEMGLNTLGNYYNENIDYDVIDAEIKFDVPIIYPDGTKEKRNLYGLIDVVILRKGQLMIVDYKTSKEPYSKFIIDTSLQLSIYSYAFRYLIKNKLIDLGKIKKNKEDYISYYVLLKDYENLNGKIKMQRKKITDKQYNKMFYTIKTTLKGIKNEIFIPNYNSMCKWCEYRKDECLNFEG